jgi:hypothetical protein
MGTDEVQQIVANVFTYANSESDLIKAWRTVNEAGCSTRRDKFVALAQELQNLHPERLIFLAVKALAPLLECTPREVSSLCAWAVRHEIIEKVGTYVPHVMPQRYRVLRKK